MGARLEQRGERYHLLLDPAGPVLALPQAPASMETELEGGRWLVLLIAVWSVPDRQALELLLQEVSTLPPSLRIAARPFDDYEELETWCPEADGLQGSPLWLLMREGALQAHRVGSLDPGELRHWIDASEPS